MLAVLTDMIARSSPVVCLCFGRRSAGLRVNRDGRWAFEGNGNPDLKRLCARQKNASKRHPSTVAGAFHSPSAIIASSTAHMTMCAVVEASGTPHPHTHDNKYRYRQ